MTFSKKELVEIFGAIAVAASLFFVGLQLHLDRKVALAEQYFNRAESAKADRRSLLESDAYFQGIEESWALGWRPFYWNEQWLIAKQVETGQRSVVAVMARAISLRLSILGYDSLYYQYQQGLLDDESWSHLRASLKTTMESDEFVMTIYEAYARAALKPVIDEILKEIEAENPH